MSQHFSINSLVNLYAVHEVARSYLKAQGTSHNRVDSTSINALTEVLMPLPLETKQDFSTILLSQLQQMSSAELDQLPFGVVGISRDGLVEIYNATESRMGGILSASAVGTPFFLSVAQCMNNFMVAQRFVDEPELDATLPYVLTFRMRPTPVTLRLLQSAAFPRSYVLIQR